MAPGHLQAHVRKREMLVLICVDSTSISRAVSAVTVAWVWFCTACSTMVSTLRAISRLAALCSRRASEMPITAVLTLLATVLMSAIRPPASPARQRLRPAGSRHGSARTGAQDIGERVEREVQPMHAEAA